MKIVAVSHYSYQENKAGGERYLQAVLEYLAKDHDITAIFTNSGFNETLNGVKITRNHPSAINCTSADLYIAQFTYGGQTIAHAHKTNKPVALIVHNDNAETTRYLEMLNENDLAIFNTNWINQKLKTKAKMVVLRPPVKTFAKTKVGEYITHINPTVAKGVSSFYNAAAHLPTEKFLLVKGGYSHDSQRAYPSANITVVENTEDLTEVYNDTKILLAVSYYESFSMVAKECALIGIPVIACDTLGLRENLGDDYKYLVRYNDFKTVNRMLGELLDEDAYKQASEDILKRSKRIDTDKELKELRNVICSSYQ